MEEFQELSGGGLIDAVKPGTLAVGKNVFLVTRQALFEFDVEATEAERGRITQVVTEGKTCTIVIRFRRPKPPKSDAKKEKEMVEIFKAVNLQPEALRSVFKYAIQCNFTIDSLQRLLEEPSVEFRMPDAVKDNVFHNRRLFLHAGEDYFMM
jgi:hypothetical protein